MHTFRRFFAILMVFALLVCLLCACAGEGEPTRYEQEHTHVYGHWYDSTEAGREVRYCKICGTYEVRVKE